MIIGNVKKDSILTAKVRGIELNVRFFNSEISSYNEVNSNYLSYINQYNVIKVLNQLIKSSGTDYNGYVKVILTIKRSRIGNFRNLINFDDNLELVIAKSIKTMDNRYVSNLSLLILGSTTEDTFDENYECELCKHFSSFEKVPKIKTPVELNEDDIDNLFSSSFYEDFYINSIDVNNEHEISIIEFATKLDVQAHLVTTYYPDFIALFYQDTKQSIPIDLIDVIISNDHRIDKHCFYLYNNRIMFSNIKDHIIRTVKQLNLPHGFIIKNGNIQI